MGDAAVEKGNVLAPASMVSIVHGGIPFDKNFNNRTPVAFRVPSGVRQVRLVSVISGNMIFVLVQHT